MNEPNEPGAFDAPPSRPVAPGVEPATPLQAQQPPTPPFPPTEPPAAGGVPPFAPPAAGSSSTPGGADPAPTVPATAPAPDEKGTPGWKAWVAAGAVAAVIAVGAGVVLGGGSDGSSTTSAAAATANGTATGGFPGGGAMGGAGTAGEVSATDGSTLTVTGTDASGAAGETTVETDADTVVTETREGQLDDLEVGDNVVVMGEADGGTVAAQRIVDSGDTAATAGFGGPGGGAPMGTPPGGAPSGDASGGAAGMPGAPTAGEITAIDGDTVTVETSDGETITVTTSEGTEVSITETIEVSAIAQGDTVMVMGQTTDGVVTATSIRVGELGAGTGLGGGMPPSGAAGGAPGTGAGPAGSTGSSGSITGT